MVHKVKAAQSCDVCLIKTSSTQQYLVLLEAVFKLQELACQGGLKFRVLEN
ncbi:hypothetical protein PC116_g16531 [Phytophthora cactorum]|nr:hypothetical protein PC116_g16531 [Phytophthora cactorum]